MPEPRESLDGTGGVSKEVVRRLRDWVPPSLKPYKDATAAWLSMGEEQQRDLMLARHNNNLSQDEFAASVINASQWGSPS